MSPRSQKTIAISVRTAIRQTGLSDRHVRECIQRSLVSEPLTDADLVELRRIRRLQELGVNMPGIEVILHMRQRIRSLQADLERLERQWEMSSWSTMEDRESGTGREPWQHLLPWDEP
jgi:hypothetical protein